MIVLSLFDGMSCGQIALKELGCPVKYYASEIDQHAIKQTQLNFPNTVQLGNVTNWGGWNLDWSSIDLVLAGSPCQGFSFAGKQLAFDDPRSKLFFVFVEILNHIKKLNPDVKFLLENVNMKKDHLRVISEYVGVFPVNINSNLVSAQNRDRWYWTNIRTKKVGLFDELYVDIPQPKDLGILLKDILEIDVDEKYFVSRAVINIIERKTYSEPQLNPDKTGALNTKNNSGQMSIDSGTTFISVISRDGDLKNSQQKASSLTIGGHGAGNHSDMDLIVVNGPACIRFGRTEEGKELRKKAMRKGKDHTPFQAKEIIGFDFEKMNTITCATTKDNLIMIQRPHGFNDGGEVAIDGKTPSLTKSRWEQNNLIMTTNYLQWDNSGLGVGSSMKSPKVLIDKSDLVMQINPSKESGGKQPYQPNRIYNIEGISPCLNTDARSPGVLTQSRIRRLTPTECARLQTIPEWYKWECSDTQIYRMCGNGWTVEVIKHILSYLSIFGKDYQESKTYVFENILSECLDIK